MQHGRGDMTELDQWLKQAEKRLAERKAKPHMHERKEIIDRINGRIYGLYEERAIFAGFLKDEVKAARADGEIAGLQLALMWLNAKEGDEDRYHL